MIVTSILRRATTPLVCCVLTLSTLGFGQNAPEGSPTPARHLTLEDVSPEKTLAFASFTGLDGCARAAEDLGVYRLFAEPEMQAFLAPLMREYDRLAAETPDSVADQWEMMKAMGRGRIAMALTGITLVRDASIPVMPAAIIAVDVGSAREDAASLLGEMLAEFGPMLDEQGVERAVKPFKGVDVNVFKLSLGGFDVSLCYAFLDNLLLVSLGQGPIRRAINLSQRENAATLSKSALFRRCRSKNKGHTVVEFFAGIAPLLSRTRLFIPDEIEKQIEDVGLGKLGAVYMASSVHEGDSFDTIYLDAPAPRSGLLALDGGRPLSAATLRLFPADALAGAAFRLDTGKAFDLAWDSIQKVGGESMSEMVSALLAEVEAVMNLDLRKDILAAIGPEMAVYAAMPQALGMPKFVASIGIRDAEKARKLIGLVLDNAPLSAREIRHADHVITMLSPADGPMGRSMMSTMGSPCFCLLEDRLLISPTRSGLEQALDRLAGPAPQIIRADTEPRRTLRGLPMEKASAIWWIDARRVLSLGYEIAYDLIPGMAPPSAPVDATLMPSLETFRRHINSWGGVLHGDEDGVMLQSRLPGMASFFAAAGRFMDRAEGAPPYVLGALFTRFLPAPYANEPRHRSGR